MPLYLATILTSIAYSQHIYILFFIFGVAEGPIASTLAGFLAAEGNLHFLIAYIVLVLSDLVADSGYYALGLFGREKVVEKYGKYTHTKFSDIEKLEKLFTHHAGKTIILAKLTHVVGVPFLVAAGLSRTKFLPFMLFNAIATITKTLGFMLLGFYSKQAADRINAYLEYGTFIGIGILVLLIFGYFMFSRYMYKRIVSKSKEENQ